MHLATTAKMGELRRANGLLGDRKALDDQWSRYGYWYFRKVLDRDAIAAFRAPVLAALKSAGLVADAAEEPVLAGDDLSAFPAATHAGYLSLPGLARSRRWEAFLADPSVAAFFAEALDAAPSWVPVAELRVHPPRESTEAGLLTFPHQDGFYNEGYRCLTAWIPLWPIDRAAGGLALAEGQHRRGYLHDRDRAPRFPIPVDAIPSADWRTADYEPGDVVLFDRHLPHSGLRNRSRDRFRVSFDIRCVLPGDTPPVTGLVEEVTPAAIRVRTAAGRTETYRLEAASFCRATGPNSGQRLALEEVPAHYPRGQEVFLTVDHDRVTLLREPKY